MQVASLENYQELFEEAEQDCQGLRTASLRDTTSKQKFNTGARYRRRSSGSTGSSGAHRRRHKLIRC